MGLQNTSMKYLLAHINEVQYYSNLNYTFFSRYALAFCTAHIIEEELSEFKREWNCHKIRKNHKTVLPFGIPNDLFDYTVYIALYISL